MFAIPCSPLALALVFGILAGACAAPPKGAPVTWDALEAPTFSPPGEWPIGERIAYWEEKLPYLPAQDLSEARLRLGELYLDHEQSSAARLSFYSALGGPHSAMEEGYAEYGVARSYLLEGKTGLAEPHLKLSLRILQGPEREEAQVLLDWSQGRGPTAMVASLKARLAPYLRGAPPSSTVQTGFQSGEVIPRSRWRAKYLRSNHQPMTRPYRITIHHTAEPMVSSGLQASIAEVRGLQQSHQQEKGWADIGYHFLIDRAGRVFEGRDLKVQGAHAGNDSLNRGNIGICLLGNFHSQPSRGSVYTRAQSPSSLQIQGLDQLVSQLRGDFKIARNQIKAHGELKETQCPGGALRIWVQSYRRVRL